MNTEHIIIRRETEADRRAVEQLVRESFWNVYRPGCTEHFVLRHLRNDPAFIPELNLVMEYEGELIGQNVFVRTALALDNGGELPVVAMGPICIAPAYKRKGFGKRLLDESFSRAADLGIGGVCFEGNILFYGKSGCVVAATKGIRYHGMPEGEVAEFFLCRELKEGYFDGISGEYITPKGYFVAEENPELFEEYDATFPKKEKLRLPTQLFS